MTSQLFTDFLKWFDTDMGKKEQNRHVLLFMVDAGVHNSAVENLPLKHTKVVFFFKNTVVRKSLHNQVLYKLMPEFQNEYSQDRYKIINIALVLCWASRAWSQVQ